MIQIIKISCYVHYYKHLLLNYDLKLFLFILLNNNKCVDDTSIVFNRTLSLFHKISSKSSHSRLNFSEEGP